VSLADSWRAQAAAIREKAQPLQERITEVKAKMKRCSEFEGEQLLRELQSLRNRIAQLAREASNCDAQARGDIGGLR